MASTMTTGRHRSTPISRIASPSSRAYGSLMETRLGIRVAARSMSRSVNQAGSTSSASQTRSGTQIMSRLTCARTSLTRSTAPRTHG